MEFKYCYDCKQSLPLDMFYKNKHTKDGLQSLCKKCSYLRMRKYQQSHPEKVQEYSKRHWNKYRDEKIKGERIRMDNRQKFLDTLKTPCVKCGENRVYVIQFHHKDHNLKTFSIGEGANYHKSKEDVINEAKKCVCLCANCHKEYHYLYGIRPERPVETLEEYLKRGDE